MCIRDRLGGYPRDTFWRHTSFTDLYQSSYPGNYHRCCDHHRWRPSLAREYLPMVVALGMVAMESSSSPGPDRIGYFFDRQKEALKDQSTVSVLEMLLSLIHISEPTRLGMISYAVFC